MLFRSFAGYIKVRVQGTKESVMNLRVCLLVMAVVCAGSSNAQPERRLGPLDSGLAKMYGPGVGVPIEERGQRIHESQVERQLDKKERNEGDSSRLREEQNYRRSHTVPPSDAGRGSGTRGAKSTE